jgi:hypothetical protein
MHGPTSVGAQRHLISQLLRSRGSRALEALDDLHDLPNLRWGKQACYPLRVDVSERAFVEPLWAERALLCQAVDHKVDKLGLPRIQRL